MIVTDFGFNEDAIIAALLHDTLEDTEIDPLVIRGRFGDIVLEMVRDVTEPAKPRVWKERKLEYISQLCASPRVGTWAVAAPDKIHNLSKMTRWIEAKGNAYLEPFTARLPDMLWYHDAVLATLRESWNQPILDGQERRYVAFRSVAQQSKLSRDAT